MSSALRVLWLIVVLVDTYCVLAIQVPIYPQGYSEGHNNHPKALRQTSGYRIPTQKFKKQTTHRSPPVYRQQINFNSPAPFNDAIRIVDPPNFFQEQKKYYMKAPSFQFGNINVNKPPTASAWKQREPSLNGNDYHLPTKTQDNRNHADYRPRGQHLKQIPIRQIQDFHQASQSFPPQRLSTGYNRQEYRHPTTSDPKRETPPNARIREFQEPSNSPKYLTSHQSIVVEQPRPTPTYLGIQNPNSGSIRAQLQDLKERQKSYFEDDEDHFPISPKNNPKKYRNKPKPSSAETPVSLGHDIYNEENNQFQKTKTDYFGVKTHAAATTTQEPDTSEPTFVPFKLLASVRHTTRVAHQKRNPTDPRAKARFKTQQAYTVHSEQAFEEGQYDHGEEERHVDRKKEKRRSKTNSDHLKNSSTKRTRTKRSPYKPKPKEHVFIKKVQTVYSEQGYEDLAYDHGDEDRHANYTKKYRPKRSTHSKDTEEFIEELEELPVALSLVGPGGEKLTGKALINHITELLKNSSKYLPEDEPNGNSDIASVILPPEELNGLLESSSRGGVPKTFSEHHLDTSFAPAGSPEKYINNIAKIKPSPYQQESETNCGDRNYNFEQNNDKKKLGDLGKQLDCYKEKFFGNNPFSNPFFSDDVIPGYSTLKAEAQNPSSLVYDDVMKTIQNSLKSEKHLAALPARKIAPQIGVVDPSKFESFTHTSTVSPSMVYKEIYSSLPIFDITKYFPKVYMIRPNGKIYSIKFRPKQSSIEQSVDPKKMVRNAARNDKGKTVVSRNLPPKRRVVEPTNVYRFSHEDAIRRPRQHLLRLKTN